MCVSHFIKVTNLNHINTLVSLASQASGPVELHRGRWCVDAASLMGVMSLDLTQGTTIVYDDVNSELDKFIQTVKI